MARRESAPSHRGPRSVPQKKTSRVEGEVVRLLRKLADERPLRSGRMPRSCNAIASMARPSQSVCRVGEKAHQPRKGHPRRLPRLSSKAQEWRRPQSRRKPEILPATIFPVRLKGPKKDGRGQKAGLRLAGAPGGLDRYKIVRLRAARPVGRRPSAGAPFRIPEASLQLLSRRPSCAHFRRGGSPGARRGKCRPKPRGLLLETAVGVIKEERQTHEIAQPVHG